MASWAPASRPYWPNLLIEVSSSGEGLLGSINRERMTKVKVIIQSGSFLKLSQECVSSSLKTLTQGKGAFYTLNEKIRISYGIYRKVMACSKTPNQNPHERGDERVVKGG